MQKTIRLLSKRIITTKTHKLKKTVFIKMTKELTNPLINQILKIEISMVKKTMIIFITGIIEIGIKNLTMNLME